MLEIYDDGDTECVCVSIANCQIDHHYACIVNLIRLVSIASISAKPLKQTRCNEPVDCQSIIIYCSFDCKPMQDTLTWLTTH